MKLAEIKPKKVARFLLDTHLWNPMKAKIVLDDYIAKDKCSSSSNEEHILAALQWIQRAQDVTGCGGVAGRYLLDRGWTYPYPETSGHIVSTMIKASKYFDNNEYWERANKIVRFLLSVQMDEGAFQGGEYIAGAKRTPAVFNTGQIMLGLLACYQETYDDEVLESLKKAAEWLVTVQEPDGSWQKYTYGSVKPTNYTRVAWPLTVLGRICSEDKYIGSAQRYIDWIMTKADPKNGWIDNMGFYREDHIARKSLTHTMAYAYRGLLELGFLYERNDLIEIVATAARKIIQRFNMSGYLSGVYDAGWHELEKYSCLTGNCQLSIIWLKLFNHYEDEFYFLGAKKAMEQVKSYQKVRYLDGGIRGGIAGSRPIWGGYITYGYPNWAAKFFIDALLLIEQADDIKNHQRNKYNFFDKE